jgi:hypothetical protein
MQVQLQAKDDPFHIDHRGLAFQDEQKPPAGGAQSANSPSPHPVAVLSALNDTFANTSVQQTVREVVHEPRKVPPVSPGPGSQRAELLEYIKQQLDCFGKTPLLMNRYQLLGPDHRVTGGAFNAGV